MELGPYAQIAASKTKVEIPSPCQHALLQHLFHAAEGLAGAFFVFNQREAENSRK